MGDSSDRSVNIGGNVSGTVIQTGDKNRASQRIVQLPEPSSVDIAAVLAELRTALTQVAGPNEASVARALEDASDEASKPSPDKAEVVDAVGRAIRHVERAGTIVEKIEKVRDLVVKVGGWAGAAAPYVAPLLATVGISLG